MPLTITFAIFPRKFWVRCRWDLPLKEVSIEQDKHTYQPPQTLADLRELPQEFKLTTKGERFLLYDSYEDGELNDDDEDPEDDPRILIFSTRENLKNLGQSKTCGSVMELFKFVRLCLRSYLPFTAFIMTWHFLLCTLCYLMKKVRTQKFSRK